MSTNKAPQSTESQPKNPQTKPATDTAPNPSRFANFTLLKDETGFRIPNCDHIFEFDVYGGWFDEHKNYYNADGQPQTPPEYDDDEEYGGFDEDEAERLAREYDMGDDDYDDDMNHYDNIYLNAENNRVLQNYLKDQEVSVEIRNVNFNVREDEFQKFLDHNKIDGDFEFDFDNRERFRGVVYVTVDKPNAEKLITFNGQRLFGRDVKINVMRPEDDEDDAQVGAGIAGLNIQDKQEEKKSSWRAQPTEKTPEATSTTQAQPQPETQKQGQANAAPGSEVEKSQGSQQQQQQKASGFERNQGYNADQRQGQGNNQYNQRNQGYGNQQNQYYGKNQQQGGGYQKNNYNNPKGQNYNQQGPIQRNTNYNQNQNQNQYQGQGSNQNYQQYPQGYTQYPVQGQMPMPAYPSYGYPQQMPNQYMYQQQYQNFPQQQWNPGHQQGYGGYQGQQQQYQGQNQGYNPGFERNQIPQQNMQAPKVSGFETLPGQNQAGNQATGESETQGAEEGNQGGWGKPLAKKKQG